MYSSEHIRRAARDLGFELCGIARAEPAEDAARYREWTARGFAGEMGYLTDHRAAVREDPRELLASAQSIICLGKVYNWPAPSSTEFSDESRAWISRYAWGDDYHEVMREGMGKLVARLRGELPPDSPTQFRVCVDTAPLLERSYARLAGLGWIGRNTCLINQQLGSWVFLGEILTSLEIAPDGPPPDRCGTCRRCIDACPTQAIVPAGGGFTIDSRLCISYFTIELRTEIPEPQRDGLGHHAFGCDICQDVCPWNRRAAVTHDSRFAPRHYAPDLGKLAELTESGFQEMFRGTPIPRARYRGFLRNVALAMGNSGNRSFIEPLERLCHCGDALVENHAAWAIARLRQS